MSELEYEWITYEDLKNIISDTSFISEKEYNSLSSLDQIEKLCILYEKLFKEAEIEFIKKDSKSTFAKYEAKSSFQQKAKECLLLGFNIVYRLRSVLFQEDIRVQEMMFSCGKPVGIFEKNMVDLLKENQIKISLNQGTIDLDACLTKVGIDNLKKDHIEKWNKILQYSGIGYPEDFEAKKGDTYKYNNKTVQRFRHRRESTSMVFTGDPNSKRSIKYYYMKSENDYMLVNRGNLFEWFEDTMAYFSESTIKNPKSLFLKMMERHGIEGIAGWKQGDYYSKKEQQWIQSKYGNSTLNQLRDIHNVILSNENKKGILNIIQDYKEKNNVEEANKQIQNDFLNLFTTAKENVNRGLSDEIAINRYLELEENNKIIANLGI